MPETWQLRMKHERDWRDAGVELGLRRAPAQPDAPGCLASAGPLMKTTPALDALFIAKGHDSMIFEHCRCQHPPNVPVRAGVPK